MNNTLLKEIIGVLHHCRRSDLRFIQFFWVAYIHSQKAWCGLSPTRNPGVSVFPVLEDVPNWDAKVRVP